MDDGAANEGAKGQEEVFGTDLTQHRLPHRHSPAATPTTRRTGPVGQLHPNRRTAAQQRYIASPTAPTPSDTYPYCDRGRKRRQCAEATKVVNTYRSGLFRYRMIYDGSRTWHPDDRMPGDHAVSGGELLACG